ncbi:MAG: AbrB/MazE/SpoVT family DNA-binding domain-containing protein [Cyanobacteria bacterium P01_A01_bin.105]
MSTSPASTSPAHGPSGSSAELVTRTRIVKIGNSQGIRIPKRVLEQLGLTGEVELLVDAGQLVIRNVQCPRADWASQFQAMAASGDDQLLDPDTIATAWDEDEWTW